MLSESLRSILFPRKAITTNVITTGLETLWLGEDLDLAMVNTRALQAEGFVLLMVCYRNGN